MSEALAIQDAEVVEVEPVPSTSMTLFGTDDPVAFIERATSAAQALAKVVTDQELYKQIGKNKHVFVQGWTLLGSMLGVFPVCVWTRKLEDGWEARVEARTRSGEIVGAAEAECLRSESKWKNSDDYAIRSMAQPVEKPRRKESVTYVWPVAKAIAPTMITSTEGISTPRTTPRKPPKALARLGSLPAARHSRGETPSLRINLFEAATRH